MAIANTPSYSEWLNENPDVMNGLSTQPQPETQVTINPGPATVNTSNPAVDTQAERANLQAQRDQQRQDQELRQKRTQAVAGAIFSGNSQVKPQYGLQGNLYQSGSKVQSDAPQVQSYQGMDPHYMRHKVGQIVAAVMSYGASTTQKGDGSLKTGTSQSPQTQSTDWKGYGGGTSMDLKPYGGG